MHRRGSGRDAKTVKFVRTSRMTMMPIVSAAGSAGPVLYVFKGTQMPYRTVRRNSTEVTESLSPHFPRNAIVTMRPEIASVDSKNFYEWAVHFVDHVGDLTANNRKVLLIYDGCPSHMSLRVLELFRKNGIVVYAHRARLNRWTSLCFVSLSKP